MFPLFFSYYKLIPPTSHTPHHFPTKVVSISKLPVNDMSSYKIQDPEAVLSPEQENFYLSNSNCCQSSIFSLQNLLNIWLEFPAAGAFVCDPFRFESLIPAIHPHNPRNFVSLIYLSVACERELSSNI